MGMILRLRRIVSGGQTGADRGGWDAAIKLGFEWGGWVPRGCRAEDGTIPAEYRSPRRLIETPSSGYQDRTERNVDQSDATLVVTRGPVQVGSGSGLTIRFAASRGRPTLHVDLTQRVPRARPHLSARAAPAEASWPMEIFHWLCTHEVRVLNVAGSRESRAPGIQAQTKSLLISALSWKERAPIEE